MLPGIDAHHATGTEHHTDGGHADTHAVAAKKAALGGHDAADAAAAGKMSYLRDAAIKKGAYDPSGH